MKENTITLDAEDRRILTVLQREGRMPIVELARRVHQSETTCLRRVRSLEAAGVITGYRAEIAREATGFPVTAFIQVSLDQRVEAASDVFKSAVMKEAWVLECHSVAGAYDHLLKVVAPDNLSLSQFVLKRLATYDSVRDFQTVFVLDTVKEEPALPLA